jgi:hypothetical protein
MQVLRNLPDKLKLGELILICDQREHSPQIRNGRAAKKSFSHSLRGIFPNSSQRFRYSSGDILGLIRNAISIGD